MERREQIIDLLNNNVYTKTPFTKTSNLVIEIHRIYCPKDFKSKPQNKKVK